MKSLILKISILLIPILGLNNLNATEIKDYFLNYRKTGQTDYQTEKEIIETHKLSKLIEQLTPYYADSLVLIRLKAYYLTYKKGIQEQPNKSTIAVNQLLKGCFDENGGVVGQNLGFLQEFPLPAFNIESKNQLKDLLNRRQILHFKNVAMLAGYVGAASDAMQQQLLLPGITAEKKWALSLGLARQGNTDCIEFCINSIKKVPVGNDLIKFVIPDLLYIREKKATDYCVELLNMDEKLCTSADPDKQEKILCGYYIVELLAPVILNFPYKTDGTGSLVAENYESALIAVKAWFQANPNYTLNKDIY